MVPTTIEVTEAPNGSCSVLKIKTADRPGLLVDIVRVLKDVNLNVVSAEVDTVGTEAEDEFFVTYRVSLERPWVWKRTACHAQQYVSHANLLHPTSIWQRKIEVPPAIPFLPILLPGRAPLDSHDHSGHQRASVLPLAPGGGPGGVILGG